MPAICKFFFLKELKGHKDRANCILFHPASGKSSPDTLNLASSSADLNVCLWSLEKESPLAQLSGHTLRINRLAFHPSGKYLASASQDLTWRLWDLETQKCILDQEGHTKSVFTVAFQIDGALIASAGQDSIGRVWDLRSGKSIFLLRGHAKQITGLDFNPTVNYEVATCGEDNTIRIFDLRKKRNAFTIPAHSNLISQVKYSKNGEILYSSSFDKTCKIFSTVDWSIVKTFVGTECKIMCCDLSDDYKTLITANFDRKMRIFST